MLLILNFHFILFYFILLYYIIVLTFLSPSSSGFEFSKAALTNMIAYTNRVVIVVVIGYLTVVGYRLVYPWESRPETSSMRFCRSVCRMKKGLAAYCLDCAYGVWTLAMTSVRQGMI
ncbi:hypothetical protein BDV38DRAFT_266708, partial [Aspergillus pseudotamarii]